ncbi:sulfite reductase beta subunit Sir1 [Schizosaccharomyces pombe]|uniref:Sulfite reductase [NADPH] subunit beta n=1 Tax=Schizosaccharomyces pombe (strain 972 / ATCC 24843) TaxID=284812 RepID=MET5_SCHPO|nr:sulfite reductase Sir1 [Schizosaccharomyces pombe]Q1K9C2.1 RecName: Full=Sulfite reductase [NADPH] subunit beta [Schizosaccharomyces pombe 972h-]CAB11176.1 sulfite reductase Sir1 [Schizosaccharomyces pombe]|eukprot:NP_593252.1 sulfite reductase Sir1 [Schizosaccharomyces pombe]
MSVKASINNSQEAVSRIAFRCSDALYVVHPNNSILNGALTESLKDLKKFETLNVSGKVPHVLPLKSHADPFAHIADAILAEEEVASTQPKQITSVVASADALFFATPHLYKLAHEPLVAHVAIESTEAFDFASVRDTGFVILFSGNRPGDSSEAALEDTLETASLAHRLALKLNTGVLHFYSPVYDTTAALENIETLPSKEDAQHARVAHIPIEEKQEDSEKEGNIKEAFVPPKFDQPERDAATSEYLESLSIKPFEYSGSDDATDVLLVFGSAASELAKAAVTSSVAVAIVRVLRPWLPSKLQEVLPTSTKRLTVLEPITSLPRKWDPLYLDVLSSFVASGSSIELFAVRYGLSSSEQATEIIKAVRDNLSGALKPSLVCDFTDGVSQVFVPTPPSIEEAYHKLLHRVFKSRLNIVNDPASSATKQNIPSRLIISPQFALGSVLEYENQRRAFCDEVATLLKEKNSSVSSESLEVLSNWIVSVDNLESPVDPELVISELKKDSSAPIKSLLDRSEFFTNVSHWIIGSDAWAYDLGNSALHQVLCLEKNVNLLIVDTQPYSTREAVRSSSRKKDIGLYAMNFGNAYVASTALYSSYTQLISALLEADKFKGPSVVLAYLPYHSADDDAITVLQETKKAVDIGYWPLYRWTPALEDGEYSDFKLDSERIRRELKTFLERDNYLTQLTLRVPSLARTLTQSFGAEVRHQQNVDSRNALNKLIEGLSGPPLTILFASDGGTAENVAKRLQNRASARGSKCKIMAMDDFPIEELGNEKNVVVLVSTAGQGEFPQNGREFWEAIKGADLNLSELKYGVFGFGDYEYWPRKEDKIYYNRPGKQLDARFVELGAAPLVTLGLGNDQDPDGWETAYNLWEPELWKALGLDNVEIDIDEPKPITNEDIKQASNFLRGTIFEGLADESTGALAESDCQLTKFHGIYMQDDRDIRDERKKQGLEPAYGFMIRARMPAGVCTPEQWIAMDDISTKWGNHTLKITTRQTFQWHGVLKKNLRNTIRNIVKVFLTTLGACGDVARNVTCSSTPNNETIHDQLFAVSKQISNELLPTTSSYHEIWIEDPETVEKRKVAGEAVQDVEPLYGPTYLPRKFKVGVAAPPYNDVDVYTNDVALIAIIENDKVLGFNVGIGGGMGTTHNNKKTYPRLATVVGYVLTDKIMEVVKAILIVQRDNGDRENRKHARLKYTVDTLGVSTFVEKVEEVLGYKFEEARDHPQFIKNHDDFEGWHKTEKNKYWRSIFVENGRIENNGILQFKTGLRELAERLYTEKSEAEFRLTANQHVILFNVAENELGWINEHMAKYKLDNNAFSGLRLSSAACVALPTCGLAMAESERYLPKLITKVEEIVYEAGLQKDSIVMRMTGCPNGCSRPWVAEIACVGKAPNTYNLMLGGGFYGQRLNKLYRSSVQEKEILNLLRPLIKRYALEREDGEHFGDWVIRAGIITAVENGGANGAVHEGVSPEAF